MNDTQLRAKLREGKVGKYKIDIGVNFRMTKQDCAFWFLRYTINGKRASLWQIWKSAWGWYWTKCSAKTCGTSKIDDPRSTRSPSYLASKSKQTMRKNAGAHSCRRDNYLGEMTKEASSNSMVFYQQIEHLKGLLAANKQTQIVREHWS